MSFPDQHPLLRLKQCMFSQRRQLAPDEAVEVNLEELLIRGCQRSQRQWHRPVTLGERNKQLLSDLGVYSIRNRCSLVRYVSPVELITRSQYRITFVSGLHVATQMLRSMAWHEQQLYKIQ